MIGDEKRHKVARNLRCLACTPDEIGITEHAVIRDLGISAGIYDDSCRSEDVLIVADLIDRPTCENTSGYRDVFKCGKCGFKGELMREVYNKHDQTFNVPYLPHYCPFCGAEVIE